MVDLDILTWSNGHDITKRGKLHISKYIIIPLLEKYIYIHTHKKYGRAHTKLLMMVTFG